MSFQVNYRPFRNEDAKDLVKIILDTWTFDDGVMNAKQSDHIGFAYLYGCMLQADFTQVAEIEGRAVGIIMGRTCGKRLRPWIGTKLLYHSAMVMLGCFRQKNDQSFEGYGEKSDMLDEMSGVTSGAFDAEVALFIVSKEVRGSGVGSELFRRLNEFFEERGIQHYYLHTDTACNYEFYERKGLKRQAELQTEISYAGADNIKMFVYGK